MNKISTSNIVVIAISCILAGCALGFLGHKVFGKKEKNDHIKNTPATPGVSSKTHSQKKKEKGPNYKLAKGSFTTPDELMTLLFLEIFKEKELTGPEDCLVKLIRGSELNIDDYNWYNDIPRNVAELENTLKSLKLYEQYQLCLANYVNKKKA